MLVRVCVPASTSNLGPGFDCLGLALDLHLILEASAAGDGLRIEATGPEAAQIPVDSTNLVYASLSRVLRSAGKPSRGLSLRVTSDIPLGRGLGSSGAAILAGIVAGHLLAGQAEPDRDTVLREAFEIEGHPDNVAASLLGGLVACALEGDRVLSVRLPFPADLIVLLVVPEYQVATEAARLLLPRTVPLADAVFDLSHLALLIGGLCRDDLELLRAAMQDRLHQEHRLGLVPGLGAALAALREERGCLAAAVSGAGPTLFALRRDAGSDAGAAAVDELRRHGVRAQARVLRPDLRGATWERLAQSA